jgi:hypothetical protein
MTAQQIGGAFALVIAASVVVFLWLILRTPKETE